MRFGEERCNWKTIIRSEVLNAFAPRSAWIWRTKQASKVSSPKDDTRVIANNEEGSRFSKLLEKLKIGKKLIFNPHNERNKTNTTKTDDVIEKKTRKRLIICNGSKVKLYCIIDGKT